MSIRSVRLDDEAESALAEIMNRTGFSISTTIKEGLLEYRMKAVALSGKKPSDFFEKFDLGDGGYAVAPVRKSESAIKRKLKNRRTHS